MASGGTYKITSGSTVWEAPAPVETNWEDQPIDMGLNGIPILAGYRLHTWNIGELEGCQFDDLLSLIASQQSGNSQLSVLETDPYDATLQDTDYATTTYTDFIIRPIPRQRGLPHYQNVTVTFEIFVS